MLRILGSPKRLCEGWTRREMLRAGGSLTEVGQVLRHRGRDVTSIYAKVDRAALSQVVLDGIRIGRPLGLEMREIGCPVSDRPGDDLVARAEWLALAEQRMADVRVSKVVGIPGDEVVRHLLEPRR